MGTRLALAGVMAGVAIATVALAQDPSNATALEREAAAVLANDAAPFDARARLADRLQAALAARNDPETAGRLALLWVRAMRAAMAAIPVVAPHAREPYRTWRGRYEHDLVYNEPGGQWLIRAETLWALHDRHRATASADALAWQAVENGLHGECEGYPPCYLSRLDRLEGEYLRRHPQGAHVVDAVTRVRESCERSTDLLDGPDGAEFFNPSTDCVDLVPKAEALRAALLGVPPETMADEVAAAVAALDLLRWRCR